MDIISFGALCGVVVGIFWLIADSRPPNDDSGSWSDGIWDALTK